MRNSAHKIALGGVLAALAVVIMTMGGLIPVATYVCPMACCLILFIVFQLCGSRVAWAWYAAVSLLSLLLGPDKEAAAVFLALGYYPIIKPFFDKTKLGFILKMALFNGVTVLLYTVLMYVVGMDSLITEFRELGLVGLIVFLILGNVSFFLLDRVLEIMSKRRKQNRAK